MFQCFACLFAGGAPPVPASGSNPNYSVLPAAWIPLTCAHRGAHRPPSPPPVDMGGWAAGVGAIGSRTGGLATAEGACAWKKIFYYLPPEFPLWPGRRPPDPPKPVGAASGMDAPPRPTRTRPDPPNFNVKTQ